MLSHNDAAGNMIACSSMKSVLLSIPRGRGGVNQIMTRLCFEHINIPPTNSYSVTLNLKYQFVGKINVCKWMSCMFGGEELRGPKINIYFLNMCKVFDQT